MPKYIAVILNQRKLLLKETWDYQNKCTCLQWETIIYQIKNGYIDYRF